MSNRGVPASALILVIGDEILSGEIQDTNSAFLASGLTARGVRVEAIRVVADRPECIVAELQAARAAAELVILSGGIGPTHDDVTRQAVAELLGRRCTRHREAEQRLKRGYGPSITAAELAMADLPEGSRLLAGRRTGVFGFGVENLWVLPGVPHLLRDIFETVTGGWVGQAPFREELHTGRREGAIAEELRRIQAATPEVSIGSYPVRCEGGYRLRIVLRSGDREALAGVRARVAELLAGGAEGAG